MMFKLFGNLNYSIHPEDCHPQLQRGTEYHHTSFGQGSLSYEEAVCLYGLVIGSKAEMILETGCESGMSTCHIATALQHQGRGKVLSIEKEEKWIDVASRRISEFGLDDYVEFVHGDAKSVIEQYTDEKIDLALLDTSIGVRVAEYLAIRKHMAEGGLVILHDTLPDHPIEDMKLEEQIGTDRLVHIMSPRRMSIVQVIHE